MRRRHRRSHCSSGCGAGDIEVNTSWDDVVIAWVLAIVVVLALMA
jgi:hypothetical protein